MFFFLFLFVCLFMAIIVSVIAVIENKNNTKQKIGCI